MVLACKLLRNYKTFVGVSLALLLEIHTASQGTSLLYVGSYVGTVYATVGHQAGSY